MRATTIAGVVVVVAAIAVVASVVVRRPEEAPCGAGFTRAGARCCPSSLPLVAGACATDVGACPAPLVLGPRGCDAPAARVVVPETSVRIGPSDWEAEGRVEPRTVRAAPFAIDRFEVSVGRAHCSSCPLADEARFRASDSGRAAAGISLAEARAFCRTTGGRLPTEDEWIAAAAGGRASRYPWGDTGAVCRRAAWGLAHGPCGEGGGPDTVGSHGDGATTLGIHDMAGNVAEWVESPASPPPRSAGPGAGMAVVRGGSWASALATELRTWTRREVPAAASDPTIGFRCAYDAVP